MSGEKAANFTSDGMRLVMRYDTARKALTLWTEEKLKARDELIAAMEDAGAGFYHGKQVVTVTRTRPRRFDQIAFRADYPTLYDQFLREADEDEIRVVVAKRLPNPTRDPREEANDV